MIPHFVAFLYSFVKEVCLPRPCGHCGLPHWEGPESQTLARGLVGDRCLRAYRPKGSYKYPCYLKRSEQTQRGEARGCKHVNIVFFFFFVPSILGANIEVIREGFSTLSLRSWKFLHCAHLSPWLFMRTSWDFRLIFNNRLAPCQHASMDLGGC